MDALVEKLEKELIPAFEALADRVVREFPTVNARAYSHSVGSATDYHGHSMGVDCLVEDASDDESDNVCLTVSLAFLTTQPRVNADVCWGHPNGDIEASFFSDWESAFDWPEASVEILDRLCADIPRLSDALLKAVKRGRSSQYR
jgi:hypothetical protein